MGSHASAPGSAVSKHLPEGLLLVGTQHGRRLQVHVDIRVHSIIPEVRKKNAKSEQ
jgi:hypothetical protein